VWRVAGERVQGLVDSRAVSAERADVVVAGAGLVGLSLAYELACLGARVTLVDAGHPGRATDAGAGILSPATSLEGDADLWPFLREAGAHYPRLLERLVADGAGVSDTRYGVCGVLSLCLRSSEDTWFSPFAEAALRRAPGEVSEIGAAAAAALFPPLGPVHRVLHAPGSARVDGVESVCIEGRRNVDCDALAVAGGAWSAAMGEWLGCPLPVGPTKGQIVHLGVEADTAQWPIVQPLLTHYLVPWPGGRVACGGTFEAAAGFSVTATAGGLHELLRECLSVAPGLEGARYLETRVGLRPTSADDRALVGRVPGWANAWVATGHGANGLLQGPYSARLLAHAVIGEGVTAGEVPLPDAFDPARFG